MSNPLCVPCPFCGAEIGRRCVTRHTQIPLRKSLAHPSRIEAAREPA